jgi:hypothetical protein
MSLTLTKIINGKPVSSVAKLFPVRPGVTLLFVFLSSEGFEAKALRALVADGDFRRLAANIANVVCVFGLGVGPQGTISMLCLLSTLSTKSHRSSPHGQFTTLCSGTGIRYDLRLKAERQISLRGHSLLASSQKLDRPAAMSLWARWSSTT